jgi:hypothetical protein
MPSTPINAKPIWKRLATFPSADSLKAVENRSPTGSPIPLSLPSFSFSPLRRGSQRGIGGTVGESEGDRRDEGEVRGGSEGRWGILRIH